MRASFIILSFVVFLVRGHIVKADDKKSFSKLFDANLVNNYEKLFKVIKCQYCLTQKKGAQNEKCKKIMKECEHLLKDGEYITTLKDLMNDLKVGNNDHVYGPNTKELKKIINFLELHMQEIGKLKDMIDTIKDNKAILLVNGGNNPVIHKLNKKMKSLKNNVEYIQKSQDIITEQISKNDDEENNVLPDMFHLNATINKDDNELIQLGNIADNDEEHKFELGGVDIDEFVKNSMKDLFKDGEGFMDAVKTTLIQEGGGIGGELVSLIEKGKEIGEKIVDIEGMITNKNNPANKDGTTIEKLDHFKTELSSYEFLIISLKGIVLSKLKDILLRLLYKAYISYRTKKAIEFEEPPPTEVSEEHYLSELKKGVLELGMKILFNKLRNLLTIVKKKLFPKKAGSKGGKTEKEQKKGDSKTATPETAELSSQMLRGSVPAEDFSLMASIDSMIEEIDFYEKEIYHNPHTQEVMDGGHKGARAEVQAMDDGSVEDAVEDATIDAVNDATSDATNDTVNDATDEEEMTEQMAEEVVDQIAEEVVEHMAHDMVNMEDVVEDVVEEVAQMEEVAAEVATEVAEEVAQMEEIVQKVVNEAAYVVQEVANAVEEVADAVDDTAQGVDTPENVFEVGTEEVEAVPENAEVGTEEVEAVPENVEVGTEEEEAVPENAEVGTEEEEAVPENAEVGTEEEEAVPENGEVAPENTEVVPENAKVVPENAEVAPENAEVAPENTEVEPENTEVVPENAEVAPENAEVAPENPEAVPENTVEEAAHVDAHVAEQVADDVEEATVNVVEAVPENDAAAPNAADETANTVDTPTDVTA
uniref:Merozoite surface protein-9 n=1 Tax=Plasmodium cynomolgi TaxID=5827 RepID=Q8T9Y1_9APIC|nr:merozoite surface protein-9 precursor [Plasmodium cynomolgi]